MHNQFHRKEEEKAQVDQEEREEKGTRETAGLVEHHSGGKRIFFRREGAECHEMGMEQ